MMAKQRFFTILTTLVVVGVLVQACMPFGWRAPRWYGSNGERIYFSGASVRGSIRSTGFPGMMGPGMMGGQPTCADCHGADARGGQTVMHMQTINAPDIRWSTLTAEDDGHGHNDDDHGHPPYIPETFARALREGVDPGGQRLDPAMPRWQMTDADIADLIEFLQSK